MSKQSNHTHEAGNPATYVGAKKDAESDIVIHAHESNTDILYILIDEDEGKEASGDSHTTTLAPRGHYAVEPFLYGRVTVCAKSGTQTVSVTE